MKLIDTDSLSARYRGAAIDVPNKRLLITKLADSDQESDLTRPPNCRGFGRIRHFQRATSPGWPPNPLPIDPAARALGFTESPNLLLAQVFQNAVCNWRCWYCYVPYNLLSANPQQSAWLTPTDLLELYLAEPDHPKIIDLSGGQPDLTPEWVPWMMEELLARGLEKSIYLWSDDNLSNDYFWRFLSPEQQRFVAEYPKYGRVCCFKGFDAESFQFNTLAEPFLFNQQFELMARFLSLGVDVYAYATFTTPTEEDIPRKMSVFLDKLQKLHYYLQLRTIPLEIAVFNSVQLRVKNIHKDAMRNQLIAIDCWNHELEKRFNRRDRALNVVDVPLARRL
jgi:uncharacterized Fe-S cluster-containing radical SAM superfamily protein